MNDTLSSCFITLRFIISVSSPFRYFWTTFWSTCLIDIDNHLLQTAHSHEVKHQVTTGYKDFMLWFELYNLSWLPCMLSQLDQCSVSSFNTLIHKFQKQTRYRKQHRVPIHLKIIKILLQIRVYWKITTWRTPVF